MILKTLVEKLKQSSPEKYLGYQIDPNEGVDFIFSEQAVKNTNALAIQSILFGMQLTQLRGLHEQGLAEKNANGYTVLSNIVTEQEDYFFELFDLPTSFKGSFSVDIRGNTSQAGFSLILKLHLPDGYQLSSFQLEGPFLRVSETEVFRLTPPEYSALKAIEYHQKLNDSEKGEYENNWLIFQLQLAKKAGMNLDLGHFNNLEMICPETVGIALDETAEGNLVLTPTFGSGLEVEDIQLRLGQISSEKGKAILRVKDRFVLLDEKRLEAAHNILRNRHIPTSKKEDFLKAPSAYLDSALIDLDTGFSLRAHGAAKFIHRYFGDVEKSGVDWFSQADELVLPFKSIISKIDTDEVLKEIQQQVTDAEAKGAGVIEFEQNQFDISNAREVEETLAEAAKKQFLDADTHVDDGEITPDLKPEKAVVDIDDNDENVEYTGIGDNYQLEVELQRYSFTNLKRTPFEHQDDGIKWLLAHYEAAWMGADSKSQKQTITSTGSGALLADDMGLGKTFMTLVSIAEWFNRCKTRNEIVKPALIVAPLSLLENWQAEVEQTFYKSPFTDIVVLQAGADLKQFKVTGAKRETLQQFGDDDVISNEEQIRYSLKVGEHYDDRLDKPSRLVLTTYQTLRDYQFSLSRVNWSIVAFDEAQNIKNPNALSSIAAKALNADFKLLATGTPVENSLKDFWCLMDTATPGLLGAWQSFRKTYISPITEAEDELARIRKVEVGQQLRKIVGEYMLRRTKDENLKGLPSKHIFTGISDGVNDYLPTLAANMSGGQLDKYDSVIRDVKLASAEDKCKVILPSLLKLKLVSIHQSLMENVSFKSLSNQIAKHAAESSKMKSLLDLLYDIKKREEKVLIFATSKSVQAYVSVLVTHEFKTIVETINGDTKAVASKKDEATRKGIIDNFQAQNGFGVLIMSPVAAGVGLTVTGANNVIHLERHWNPAKEAQATDRVYRIGQQKDVNVYIPIALHPQQKSFDEHLNMLLNNKVDLSNAVVAPDIVEVDDMTTIF